MSGSLLGAWGLGLKLRSQGLKARVEELRARCQPSRSGHTRSPAFQIAECTPCANYAPALQRCRMLWNLVSETRASLLHNHRNMV